jgi:hypothetical protein
MHRLVWTLIVGMVELDLGRSALSVCGNFPPHGS